MTRHDVAMCLALIDQKAPIPVCLDGTINIIDSRTILITMYNCGYVGV